MTTEVKMLLLTAAVLFLLVLIRAGRNLAVMGLGWGAGNREQAPSASRFADRAGRAVDNHKEGLLFLLPIVVATAGTGISNGWTETGAQIYFLARLVHAGCYLAGIGLYLRSTAWGVGLAGLAVMLVGLA